MNRSTSLDVVASSLEHFESQDREAAAQINIENSPLGLDANVIIRIAQQRRADVIDFLATRHKGPLILPGQAVQEVWNNFDSFTRSFASDLESKVSALSLLIEQSDAATFGAELHAVQLSVEAFVESHPRTRTEQSYAQLESAFQMLGARATTFFVPRSDFFQLGESRFRSRTPPGFKDAGQLGDFYLWCDFLYGLVSLIDETHDPGPVVFVTNDQKKDWLVDGRPHPLLRSEVSGLVGGELVVWTLEQLDSYAKGEPKSDEPSAEAIQP